MDNNKNKPDNPRDGHFNIFNLLIVGLICSVMILRFFMATTGVSAREEIPFNAFLDLVHGGYVESVEVQSERFLIMLRDDVDLASVEEITGVSRAADEQVVQNRGSLFPLPGLTLPGLPTAESREQEVVYYTGIIYFPGFVEFLYENDVEFVRHVVDQNPLVPIIINLVLPVALIYLVFSLIMRNMSKRMGGGGIMGVGKSNAKRYNMEKATGVTFNDVAGQEEAKESLNEIIDYLHNPEKYVAIGAKQPKGALLVGPPGTGKTLLAKAVAGEADVTFFSLTGSEFVEMYVGVGASRVRDLFKQANSNAPCIIFIDEIDAVGKSRDSQMGTNDEREQTLNQLLSEMDGFDTSKGIVILAATNRPETLDKALLRPGRFDRRVIVEKPDLIGREAILAVHAKKVMLDDDVNLKRIAMATSGAAGADLANMINEGALRAVRENRQKVKQEDLMEAVEVVMAGKEKKDRVMTKKEKRIVSYHEIGHALTMALQKNSMPVQKISIVPRTMGSLGYVMYVPEEETYLTTKEEIIAQIVAALGGRAAEEIVFNTATTGAFNDIERATRLARSMVSQFGMSDAFGIMGLESVESRYLDGRPVATCAPETEALRDKEVKRILDECYDKSKSLLFENRHVMEVLAEHLFDKENITGDEFLELLKEHKPDFVVAKDEENTERGASID